MLRGCSLVGMGFCLLVDLGVEYRKGGETSVESTTTNDGFVLCMLILAVDACYEAFRN